MKLYSGKQLLLFSGFSAVLALLVTWAAGILNIGGVTEEAGFEEPVETVGRSVQLDETALVIASADYSDDEKQNILIYDRYNDAVVNITSISFSYNWFLEPVPEEGTGSGTVINQDGHILTNYHVVKGAKQLMVTLADGTDFEGSVVGTDEENDLAIIKIEPKGRFLVTIPLGNSDTILVGQKVVAIGNPFGLERTFTTGVVSGLGRPVRTTEGTIIKEMIQTDASINPGNSGGPLLNGKGQMIGINTMIYSPSGGSVGIGFAVPIATAKRVIPDLLQFGKVRRGWIEITPVQLYPPLVRYANLPVSQGVLVSEVEPGSNAEKAGLLGGDSRKPVRSGRQIIYLGGDVIVEVDGTAVKTLMDLFAALEDNKPGETVKVRVVRGKVEKVLSVTLSERT